MSRTATEFMTFTSTWVCDAIAEKYGLNDMEALRRFYTSQTYAMLAERETGVYKLSPLICMDLWEAEQITGDPRSSAFIRGEW